jgi:hypothetical protein
MNSPAMRTFRAGNILCEFHLIERALEVSGRNCLHNYAALVAEDVRDIAVSDSVQAATTLRIAEIRVGQCRSDDLRASGYQTPIRLPLTVPNHSKGFLRAPLVPLFSVNYQA